MININMYENTITNDDISPICPICHDSLNDQHSYEISECKHIFHSDCLITWLRTGNSKCPYCNSVSTNYIENEDDGHYCNKKSFTYKYKYILNYCKTKNANKKIVKKIQKIKDLENKLKILYDDNKNIKQEVGTYSEIHNKFKLFRRNVWRIKNDIFNKKLELTDTINIIPYIIQVKK